MKPSTVQITEIQESNSTIDREHEAKMKEIELNHKKAMAEIQTQTDLENEKHKCRNESLKPSTVQITEMQE